MLGRIIYFFIQAFVVASAIIGGTAAYIIHDKGMDYARTAFFWEDMEPAYPIALIAAGLISLIWICYQATKKSLERDPYDPDAY